MVSINKKNPPPDNQLLTLSLDLFASYYPKFYLLETNLKLKLFNHIREKLGNDWFTIQLRSENKNPLFEQEHDLILRRKPKGFALTDHGLLVESGLGFWVEFFNRIIYKETKGAPILIFDNLPKEIKRKDIYQKLERIKEMRNLLFHSRISPINSPRDINKLNLLIETEKDLCAILQWMGGLPSEIVNSKQSIQKAEQIRDIINEKNH